MRKEKIHRELTDLRAHVPAAIGAVMGVGAAADAAVHLNTSFKVGYTARHPGFLVVYTHLECLCILMFLLPV